jgi:acetyl esterase/lipase
MSSAAINIRLIIGEYFELIVNSLSIWHDLLSLQVSLLVLDLLTKINMNLTIQKAHCLIIGRILPLVLLVVVGIPQAFSEPESVFSELLDISYADRAAPTRPEQTLDLYWEQARAKKPVMIFVHGGGWAFGDKDAVHNKPHFFLSHGMAFISMNYRLRWSYTIYDQASDIASVIGWIADNADEYGFDPDKIVLMGIGSGAHLVSLVGTDERYLKAAGHSFSNLAAVVSIDATAYDIETHINETASFLEQRHLRLIFSDDPEVWKAASPITYVKEGRNIPAFVLLPVTSSEASAQQVNLFSKQLIQAKVEVIIVPANTETSDSIDESLGTPGDRTTLALITFVKAKI